MVATTASPAEHLAHVNPLDRVLAKPQQMACAHLNRSPAATRQPCGNCPPASFDKHHFRTGLVNKEGALVALKNSSFTMVHLQRRRNTSVGPHMSPPTAPTGHFLKLSDSAIQLNSVPLEILRSDTPFQSAQDQRQKWRQPRSQSGCLFQLALGTLCGHHLDGVLCPSSLLRGGPLNNKKQTCPSVLHKRYTQHKRRGNVNPLNPDTLSNKGQHLSLQKLSNTEGSGRTCFLFGCSTYALLACTLCDFSF